MILHVVLTLLGAAAVHGQSCKYRFDRHSPFYWRGYENICTKHMCDTYPWLKCDVAREYINDQAVAHFPEDIHMEIEYLGKYFNTLIPRPNNQLPYKCQGVCSQRSKQLSLQRIFTDLTLEDKKTGLMETNRWMCIVIGPNIYYDECRGKCQMPYGGGGDSYCVPDVHVTIDIWVFCPGANPGCHKVKFDVPLSCSCKKMRCIKPLPPVEPFKPVIPPKPAGWTPGQIGGPIDPHGVPLGPVNLGDPFSGIGIDPFNGQGDPFLNIGLDPLSGMAGVQLNPVIGQFNQGVPLTPLSAHASAGHGVDKAMQGSLHGKVQGK